MNKKFFGLKISKNSHLSYLFSFPPGYNKERTRLKIKLRIIESG